MDDLYFLGDTMTKSGDCEHAAKYASRACCHQRVWQEQDAEVWRGGAGDCGEEEKIKAKSPSPSPRGARLTPPLMEGSEMLF